MYHKGVWCGDINYHWYNLKILRSNWIFCSLMKGIGLQQITSILNVKQKKTSSKIAFNIIKADKKRAAVLCKKMKRCRQQGDNNNFEINLTSMNGTLHHGTPSNNVPLPRPVSYRQTTTTTTRLRQFNDINFSISTHLEMERLMNIPMNTQTSNQTTQINFSTNGAPMTMNGVLL